MKYEICSHEDAIKKIASLRKDGLENVALTDEMDAILGPGVVRLCIYKERLWIAGGSGAMAPVREVRKIVEHLNNSLIEIDDKQLIDSEIDSILQEFSDRCEQARGNAKPGYVYLIKGDSGRYKIGYSKNPKARLKQLKIASSEDLELISSVFVDDPQRVEKYLHESYEERRTHSEWFALEEYEAREIAEWMEFEEKQ